MESKTHERHMVFVWLHNVSDAPLVASTAAALSSTFLPAVDADGPLGWLQERESVEPEPCKNLAMQHQVVQFARQGVDVLKRMTTLSNYEGRVSHIG